nr:820_t:CDS:2 [Entrophospora candida]
MATAQALTEECGVYVKNNLRQAIRYYENGERGSHPKPNQTITRPVLNSLAEKHLQECYGDLDKIKNLGLIGRVNLPDLKEEKRVGIIKELTVIGGKVGESNSQERISAGNVLEELVFLAPCTTSICSHNFMELFRVHKKPDSFYFPCGKGKKNNAYERIIVGFFIWRILQREKE